MKYFNILVLALVTNAYSLCAFGTEGTAAMLSFKRQDSKAIYLYHLRCSLTTPDARCTMTSIMVGRKKFDGACTISVESNFREVKAERDSDNQDWVVNVVDGGLIEKYTVGKKTLSFKSVFLPDTIEKMAVNPMHSKSREPNESWTADSVPESGNFNGVEHSDCKKTNFFTRYL